MYVWENMDYGNAGSLIHDRDPRKFNWGYFANDTLPESGVGLFFWFESPAELLAFIADIETQALPDSVKAKKTLKRFDLNQGLTTELRKKINSELKDIEIRWWGKFPDLYAGKSSFSREVLNSYFGPFSRLNMPLTVYIPKFAEFCGKVGPVEEVSFRAYPSAEGADY